MIGTLIGAAAQAFGFGGGGGGGCRVDVDEVNKAIEQGAQAHQQLQDEAISPLQAINVEEFARGNAAMLFAEQLNQELSQINQLAEGTLDFNGRLQSALDTFLEADDSILKTVLGYAANPVGSFISTVGSFLGF